MEYIEKTFFPSVITPFNFKGKIDFIGLQQLIEFYLVNGAKGFFINSHSGEMYSISEEERIELAKNFVKFVKGRVPVISTGSFGLNIYDKAEFTKKLHGIGIDSVMLITGHFANIDDDEEVLLRNFERMLKMIPGIRLGLYESAIPYKRILSSNTFEALVNSNRIYYYKDASTDLDLLEAKINIAAKFPELKVFESYTPHVIYSLQHGAYGISSVSSNYFPEIINWICHHFADPEKARELDWIRKELIRVDDIIQEAYPLSIKYFLSKRGLVIKNISRAHAFELTPEHKTAIGNTFNDFLTWTQKLKIKIVNTENLLIPNYTLDPII